MFATLFNLFSSPILIVGVFVFLLFFGGKKLPGLVRAIRGAARDFRLGKRGEHDSPRSTNSPDHPITKP